MKSIVVSQPGKVLFLLAHCDDEFFVLPRIERELEIGSEVFVVFTTDGSGYNVSPEVRIQESLSVLTRYGVTSENVLALGNELGVKDGKSQEEIDRLFTALTKRFEAIPLDRVYALAWEGGHVDHDVVHLLAIALRARSATLQVFEFSAYQSKGIPGPFFRCMSLIPNEWPQLVDTVSVQESLRWLASALYYKTQRKTFFGLSPFFLFQLLVRRAAICRLVATYDYYVPPHSGALFYEKRFKVPFAQFRNATQAFISRNISASFESQLRDAMLKFD